MAKHWTDQDAVRFRAFLDNCPNFLAHLEAKHPKVTATETIEARAMSGSEVRGADLVINTIKAMRDGAELPGEKSEFIQ